MMPDRRDMMLLRLAGKYRWLPFDKLDRLGFVDVPADIEALAMLGYMGISRNKRYTKPTPKGYSILEEHNYDYDMATNRAYANSTVLRRRLETSEIMLTALRAGIDTLPDNVDALREQPTFFPAFAFRATDTNLMNNATCAGFGHWGNTAYMLHYISPDNHGMFLTNELKIFHNLASVFSIRLNEPEALIFAGDSYKQVYDQLSAASQPLKKRSKSYIDFAEVYRRTELPVHLLSCDETGAMQFALMRQPDYKARIAKAAFGSHWTPPGDALPESDGIVEGAHPLVIAADMDIRRVQRVISDARRFGSKTVMLVAYKDQIDGLLMNLLPRDGSVRYLNIKQPVLDAAFGKEFSLYSMDKTDAESKGGAPDG